MKVIGLTGGIGSGKSTIADILKKQYQAFLISEDQVAHILMQKGNISYQLIIDNFGKEILKADEEIDRARLAGIVYHDKAKLEMLNSLTHPYVMDYVKTLIKEKAKEKINIVCVETALPIEARLQEFCDEIWYVHAPRQVRRERLTVNRQYSEEKINQIFHNQISETDYKKISTHLINSDCTFDQILGQIEVLLEK